jgi:DNA-binding GntR family transcriptional regulator
MSPQKSKKRTLYETLQRAITSGKFMPGEIINEAAIAGRHGVSRTPVREALQLLAHEGLVRALPRTGYIVSEMTAHAIMEAFQLRELLEVEAAGIAAERISDEGIAELEMTRGDREEAYNRSFHMLVAQASGNSRLAELVGHVLDDMARILLRDPMVLDPALGEHDPIVAALKSHDKERAREAMRKHIRVVEERILRRSWGPTSSATGSPPDHG